MSGSEINVRTPLGYYYKDWTGTYTLRNQWHSVSLTLDGSILTQYCDTLFATTTSVAHSDSTSTKFNVGALYGSGGYYKGYIDELYIMNDAVSIDYTKAMNRQLADKDGYRTIGNLATLDQPDTEFTINIEDFNHDLDDIQSFSVSMKWYTSGTETISVDIYNFETSSWENNKISHLYITPGTKTFDIITDVQDYVGSSDEIRLRIRGDNHPTQYYTYIDYIGVEIFHKPDKSSIIQADNNDLDFQVDLQVNDEDCYIVDSISYSYITNVSATVDFDIWNWTSSTWVEIESVNNYNTFEDDSFYLGFGSDFVNSTNGVRVRFQCIDNPTDFEIQIDRLRLDYFKIQ